MPPRIFENTHIVLVATTHPGNIGAAARAMKTMGMHSLRLVRPKIFPSAEVTARAAGADDVLSRAQVVESLAAAVADCGLILAATARTRGLAWPELTPADGARRIIAAAAAGTQVAMVFGNERSGLSNEELDSCQGAIRIPTAVGYSSLNLAAAVQVICYELRKQVCDGTIDPVGLEAPPATGAQMGLLYQHLEQCLVDIGFYDPAKPMLLMRRLKRLFNRAQLDANEYNILRGILAAAQQSARDAGRIPGSGQTREQPS
jgi:TrmH family RNA methyltransferase